MVQAAAACRSSAEPFDRLRVVLIVAGNSLASYRTITRE
jgi:hypothetical protein